MAEEKKKLPELIKQSDSYRMIVPANVEEKIRYLIRKFPSTEWSGILFYTHTGSFESDDLVVVCKDIFPMNVGTSGWTEFKMSEDVTAYMAENIELFECDLGLIHSHHKIGAYFSGQDVRTLQSEGNDTNCFVSLIVDTKGEYVAAVTRKVQQKIEVVTKNLGTSYEFFGEGEIKTDEDPMTESTEIVDEEVIEYFMLTVEREVVDNPFEYLDSRIDEIEKNQKSRIVYSRGLNEYTTTPYSLSPLNKDEEDKEFFDWIHKSREPETPKYKELPIWDDKEYADIAVYDDKPYTDMYVPNKELVDKAVAHMILCSLTIKTDGLDVKQWINKHLDKMYKKLFPDCEDVNKPSSFSQWCDFIVDYTVEQFADPDGCTLKAMDEFLFYSTVASAIQDSLYEYSNNPYINAYIMALDNYIL